MEQRYSKPEGVTLQDWLIARISRTPKLSPLSFKYDNLSEPSQSLFLLSGMLQYSITP